MRVTLAIGLVLLLGGCGGSGAPFESNLTQAISMEDRVLGLDFTPTVAFPDTGTVRYDGYMGFVTSSLPTGDTTEVYAGQMNMTADFSDDTISGSASSFYDSEDGAATGTLAITGGTIDRFADTSTEYQISAAVDGTLTDQFGIDITVSADLSADFLGKNNDAVYGIINGTASGYGIEAVEGYVIGER